MPISYCHNGSVVLQLAAIAQWQSVGLVIEWLLAFGSIPNLAMRRCVVKRETLLSFLIGTNSLPLFPTWQCVVVSLKEKLYSHLSLGQTVYPLWWPNLTIDLQTEPKKVLCGGLVRQTQSAWLEQTNE